MQLLTHIGFLLALTFEILSSNPDVYGQGRAPPQDYVIYDTLLL
jgi:hypothetical protein